MNVQMLSQYFDGTYTRHLVALLNAADMSSTSCKQHVFLRYAACRAQLLQCATNVGFGTSILSGNHSPDFR